MSRTEAARDAALRIVNDARDQGVDYFHLNPDLLLIEVARHAATLFPDNVNLQIVFLSGYGRARIDQDAFERGE